MKQNIIAYLVLMVVGVVAEDQLAFVFEVVRHGARNTFLEGYTEGFPVAPGMLTPEGMRQRYLLGRYAREKYAINSTLLSPEFIEGEVYIQSTDSERTMQSGYSELMGIYPPGEAKAPQMNTGE